MKPAAPNFDSIARPYRWLEYSTLGLSLQRCRTHFLPKLLECRQALVLGDGDGRFLAELYAAHPILCATAVDTSAAMLGLLLRRCEAVAVSVENRLRICNCNALEFTPSSETDLVVAHFFFDCFSQSDLNIFIDRIAKHVRPNTLWLVSDFRIPASLMRLPARVFIHSLYVAFGILTGLRATRLPDHATPLAGAGLIRIAQHNSLAGILTTELWQAPATK